MSDEVFPKELLESIKDGKITPQQAVEQFEMKAQHVADFPLEGLKTKPMRVGFPTFEKISLFKEEASELVIVAALSSHGKSALMFQIAQTVAAQGNVLIYSFEMKTKMIKTRMMAAMTGYGATRIMKGQVPYEKLKAANDKMRALNYYIDDRGDLDISEVVSSAIDFNRKHPLKMVVVDYLQLVGAREHTNDTAKFSHVAWELKALAQRLGITVLTASQLNNAALNEGKQNRRYNDGKVIVDPSQENLKGSGDIFCHADSVIFVHRPEMVEVGDRPGVAEIKIGKGRNNPGAGDKYEFRWLGASTSFLDPMEEEL